MEVTRPKYLTIYDWKFRGVIYHNFDELYEVYIKTMNCWHCNKEFVSTRDRQLDHNHETGAFRAIVCNKCNSKDSYIRYPNGYSKQEYESKFRKNKEKRILFLKEKIKCICGAIVSRGNISIHKKTKKHLNNMDKYMENVD
jgi:hypothetical protein